MEVLDLACGHGRIANRLTQRGLDATPLFLEQARRDAAARGVEVDYVSGVCGPCLGRSTALSA
jgi:2-polyprenyl-3-methyl-5-hydroxy-6-metoxy-1,4-benzoquinol methylase